MLFVEQAQVHAPGVTTHPRGRLVVRWERAVPSPRYLRDLCLLVLAYYAAAHLGYALQFSGPVAAILWLPVGVAISFLYLGGMQLWPGVVIGDLLVNNYSALPAGTALAQTFGNLLEILVAVALLRRLCPRGEPTSSVRGVAALLVATAAGTALSAAIGSVSSWLGGVIELGTVPHVLRTWWLGDFSGALLIVPLALSWSSRAPRHWLRGRAVEAAFAVALLTCLSVLPLTATDISRVVVFPALVWVALRFGPRGATLAIAIISTVAIWAAIDSLGPFGVNALDRTLNVQVFIAAVSVSGLTIAALVSEKLRLAESLASSRARLVAASDEARRRLEHDLHDGAQQSLVGLRIRLDEATDVIARDPVRGRRIVAAAGGQVDDVLAALRTLAQGVYPAVLREHGLAEAIKSIARRSPIPVAVQASGVTRHPETVEVAVYFCCLEAIQNVVKHGGRGGEAEVRIREDGAHLNFEVTDSGPGFDTRAAQDGAGLTNMRDRIEAAGGHLVVTSVIGRGTTVRGAVPSS